MFQHPFTSVVVVVAPFGDVLQDMNGRPRSRDQHGGDRLGGERSEQRKERERERERRKERKKERERGKSVLVVLVGDF